MENTMFKNIENVNLDCRLFGYITDLESRSDFYDVVDIYLSSLASGEAQCEMPIGKEHLDRNGIVSKSALLCVAEECCMYSVFSLDIIGEMKNLSLNFENMAQKGQVIMAKAVAKVAGEKIECEIVLKNQFDVLIATGSASFVKQSDFLYTYADFLRVEQA